MTPIPRLSGPLPGYQGHIHRIEVGGRVFKRSKGFNKPGVLGHFREDTKRDSAHMYVIRDVRGPTRYQWVIDHVDSWNPDYNLLAHLVGDVF